MQILIPMAGAGQRFKDVGYSLPKPLLEVDGVPMIVRVVDDLPPASRLVFVVNRDHVTENRIDEALTSRFPGCHIVIAPGLTQGQACSVQLGIEKLNPAEDVLVAACDNTHVFHQAAFDRLLQLADVDAIIWTYRREPRVLVNPHWYGWVGVDRDNHVTQVSVKRPISDKPLQDHVVSGTFWFRSAKLLNEAIEQLIRANIRVNNEFYLDSVPPLLIAQGKGVRAFEVDKYIGWGTPDDYQDYHLWSNYVRKWSERHGS